MRSVISITEHLRPSIRRIRTAVHHHNLTVASTSAPQGFCIRRARDCKSGSLKRTSSRLHARQQEASRDHEAEPPCDLRNIVSVRSITDYSTGIPQEKAFHHPRDRLARRNFQATPPYLAPGVRPPTPRTATALSVRRPVIRQNIEQAGGDLISIVRIPALRFSALTSAVPLIIGIRIKPPHMSIFVLPREHDL